MLWGLLCIAAGIFCFMGAYRQWGFYVNDGKYRFMAKMIGEGGARLFYMGFGVLIIVLGLLFMVGVIG
ncbi:MAG: Imm17 family immunity protein [Ruminococcus sp.]|nr:Imm17 family immunity protein [Ruminococcus sp.]